MNEAKLKFLDGVKLFNEDLYWDSIEAFQESLSDGLEDIQEDVAAIDAAVEDVASSDQLEDLETALEEAQADIDELLEQGNVFSGDVTINSQSSLDAFLQIGSSLAIVSGNVNITAKQSMDQTEIQEVVNNILTITKDLTYTAEASSISETTLLTSSSVSTFSLWTPDK